MNLHLWSVQNQITKTLHDAAIDPSGSKRTCGGAAAGSQRFRSSSQPLDDRSQPEAAIDRKAYNFKTYQRDLSATDAQMALGVLVGFHKQSPGLIGSQRQARAGAIALNVAAHQL